MQIQASTIQQAADEISKLRQYAPFRFSGKWFIAKIGDDMHALRQKAGLVTRARKAGLASLEVAEVNT